MSVPTFCRWVTVVPLLFNDPGKGEVFEIPEGEFCTLFHSVEEAVKRGAIRANDEMTVWAAKTNLKRGYVLVQLRGMLRGVEARDIAEYPMNNCGQDSRHLPNLYSSDNRCLDEQCQNLC